MYFTADTHFFHKNIIKYCNRPFENVDEMNELLLQSWNNTIGRKDVVYHLGDFGFNSPGKMKKLIESLNGRIYLVLGSHDTKLKNMFFLFEEVTVGKFLTFQKHAKRHRIFLSHYCHKVWPLSHYGSWHLYGHSHGRLNDYAANEGKLLDVGVDSHGFKPWSLDEVVEIMNTRPNNFNFVE